MKINCKPSRTHAVAVAAILLVNLLSSWAYGDEFQDRRQPKAAPQSNAAPEAQPQTQGNDQPSQRRDQQPAQRQSQQPPVQRQTQQPTVQRPAVQPPIQRREMPAQRPAPSLQRREEAMQRRDQAVRQEQRGVWPRDARAERMRPEVIRSNEWFDRREGRYRSPTWQIDTRFRHNRYYPRYGTVVTTLPPNYYDVRYRGDRFYFQSGIWFRSAGAYFVVTTPPPGVIVPTLPPDYAVVPAGPVPYYYANGVYYSTAPGGPGYVVVDPPVGFEDTTTVQDSGSGNFFDEPVVVNSEPNFVYPNGTLTESQMLTDRNECNSWAAGQTGYDAATTPPDTQVYTNYQVAVKACMEGRGYVAR
ncbi:MAG: DUF6515 family protein [Pseudomonadota bacterium]